MQFLYARCRRRIRRRLTSSDRMRIPMKSPRRSEMMSPGVTR
jgi:hypothetical protein